MRRCLVACFVFLAAPAFAGCNSADDIFVSCTLANGAKRLETCREDKSASYWYGSENGKAELALTAREGEFIHRPWPGVSNTIWEELEFVNNGVSYTVYGALERIWPESEDGEVKVITHGGITVSQGGKELARLECDAGSVEFSW